MHFNYNHLRVFRAVIIHGSATLAALEVNITQSSVSRTLKEFEESVGFRLFDRERTGLRPTREALQLYKDVKRAYATFNDVKQTARSIVKKEEGQLRIAALAVYVDGIVSRNLSSFMDKYPGISIQLIAGTKSEIEKLVATEQVDLGITTMNKSSDLIKIRKLIKRSAVCILPKDHPLNVSNEITLSDLLEQNLILQYGGAPLRTMLDMKFMELGLDSKVRVELESQRAIVNMVCAGGGVGVIDPDILSDHDADQLCCLPLKPALEWSLAFISAQKVTPPLIADAFLDWMIDVQA